MRGYRSPVAGLVVVGGLLITGCRVEISGLFGPQIRGSGTIVTEHRPIGAFRSIEVSQALHARYEPGDAPKLTVEGDDNLLPYVVTKVEDGCLRVFLDYKGSISQAKPIVVSVTGPAIQAIKAEGASQVEAKLAPVEDLRVSAEGAAKIAAEGVDTPTLRIACDGASRVKLKGKAEAVELEVSGASRVEAFGLTAAHIQFNLSGASHADVHADATVKGDLSGASHAVVHGNPSNHEVGISGASSVKFDSQQAERE